jgi:cellulose biosynthesis protein BcsQ
MKVIVFYSFKGGVGRTISLLSTAYSLARRGRKVVVADWDLQAPGLSLMDCMRPAGAGPPRLGILEYLTALHPDRWQDEQPSIEDMLLAPAFIDEARGRETADGQSGMKGDLVFVPAGDLAKG